MTGDEGVLHNRTGKNDYLDLERDLVTGLSIGSAIGPFQNATHLDITHASSMALIDRVWTIEMHLGWDQGTKGVGPSSPLSTSLGPSTVASDRLYTDRAGTATVTADGGRSRHPRHTMLARIAIENFQK